MLRTILVLAALAAHATSADAQPRSSASANGTRAAFDAARLARIDQWANDLIANKRVPGMVIMLVRDGRVEYHKAFGARDASNAPLDRNDIFRIASQTKAITALATMMLWEEGKFGLDDPIGRYIPSFAQHSVLTKFNAADSSFEATATNRRITIRQLLTHSSGLGYPQIGSAQMQAIYAKAGISAIGTPGEVLASSVDIAGKLPLVHEPGERFTYGYNSDVLGRLVEVVSGMPFDQFLRTRIFEPLKMHDTWFELPSAKRERLVTLFVDSAGVWRPANVSLGGDPDFPVKKVTFFSGGGGLSSTTAEYARFLQMFINGGELDGERLLGRKTIELMLTNQLTSIRGNWGLGFGLETPENDYLSPLTVGSFFWSGAFRTYYWADPQERLVALLYTNTSGGNVNLSGTFRTLVYSALH